MDNVIRTPRMSTPLWQGPLAGAVSATFSGCVCVFPPRRLNLLRTLRRQYLLYIARLCSVCLRQRPLPKQELSHATNYGPLKKRAPRVRSRRSQGTAASVNRNPSEPEPERAEARESRSPRRPLARQS